MRHPRLVRLIALAAACGLPAGVGCAGPRPAVGHVAARPAAAGEYPPVDPAAAAALRAARPPAPGKPLNVLAVAGGGQYAAYAGGALVGWTAAGTRPEFDVVTGVSGGAFVALYAFLGPKYDATLQRLLLTARAEDFFTFRPVPVHVVRDKALASADPLRRLIAAEVGADVLADLRAAHAAGRRLFVGTMDATTRRLAVWDLGALACGGADGGDAVRTVLLAAGAIPGLVPPVPIATVGPDGQPCVELHADAGAVAQTFVRFGPHHPRMDPARPAAPWLAGANLYVIAGGKMFPDPVAGNPGLLGRVTGTVSAGLYALFRADAWRLYSLCAASGMRFHLTAIPPDKPSGRGSTKFDPAVMAALFQAGYELATADALWRHTPPGAEPGEEEEPRGSP